MPHRLACVTALVVIAFLLAGFVRGETVRFGFSVDYPPLSDAPDGEPEGFLVDLAREIGAEMEVDVAYWVGNPNLAESLLQSGELDIFFGLYYSDERAARYRFGPDVFRNSVFFYRRNGSAPRTLEEAAGRKVALSSPGSLIGEIVRARYPDVEWVTLLNFEALIEAVRSDDDFVGFVDEAFLAMTTPGVADEFTASGSALMNRGLRPVVMRGNETLLDRVSVAYNRIDAEEVARLVNKWGLPSSARRSKVGAGMALTEEERDFLLHHPTIRYAGISSWRPIAFRGNDGVFQGVEADYLDLVERELGIRFVYPQFDDREAAQESLELGLADFRGADVFTEGTSIGYFRIPLGLFVRPEDERDFSPANLAGRLVSVERGNSYAQRFAADNPQANFRFVDSERAGLELLARGEVDAHVGNMAVCVDVLEKSFARALSLWDVLDDEQVLSFDVRKDGEWPVFVGILNKAIAQIEEEQVREIAHAWFAAETKRVWWVTELWKPLAAFAALLTVAVFWRHSNVRLKRALAQAEERLLLAQKVGVGGTYEWYPKTDDARLSPEFFKILGYDEDELENASAAVVRLIHEDDLKEISRSQPTLTKQGKEYAHTFRMKRRDGKWAWILSRAVPTHFYKDGSVKRYIGVQTDITQLHETAEKLREQEALARQASRSKSEFLANMSHEIRTPMNAILGFSRLLKRDERLTPQQSEYANLINASGEHLLGLLDDILDMAKIESGRVNVEFQDWNLSALLKDVAIIFKGRCETANLDFEYEIDPDSPKVVRTDGLKVRQVVVNLLSNAIKFTEAGSVQMTTSATLEGKDGEYCIEVKDTGCGISEEEVATLFEPFTQAKAGRVTVGGTGLGVTISAEFAQLLGGRIDVESTLGVGSCFRFYFPFTVSDAATAVNDREAREIVIDLEVASRKRVLVADDSIHSLNYMRQWLSSLGFDVHLAKDGVETLVKWKLAEPDLVLLDLRMPKRTGYEVLEEIRKDTHFVKPRIVVLTASALVDDREKVIELGADDFMSKPFREEELIVLIAKLLEIPYSMIDGPDASASEGNAMRADSPPIELEQPLYDDVVAACNGGYMRRIERVAEMIADTDPAAAERLRRLCFSFDYDQILEEVAIKPPRVVAPRREKI